MLFNSLAFLVFFSVLFFGYYLIVPDKYRWILLLVASCYFYMAYIPKFILILFFLITIDYFLGRQIAQTQGHKRKVFLWLSIAANLGTLFIFKYLNFFNQNIGAVAHLLHWNYSYALLQIALPLGLSFHIFQSLSYVIEVYKGNQVPEKNYGIYALYVMFFPQLVAGPIERPQHLLHQFHEPHNFSALNVRRGLEIMLWGFFKKLVIADWIAQVVNHVYRNISGTNGVLLVLTAVLFSYQIYCDFSGYSDIAVGSALVFGYDLTKNFNRPYAAKSISEFWRRWHISLSNWLHDYLYYPLVFSGKKVSPYKIYLSLLITFTLIGLWHGAEWTYVIFGALHGLFLVFSLFTKQARAFIARGLGLIKRPALLAAWQILATFLLVTASFIFFRAESVSQALQIFGKIGSTFLHPATLPNNFHHILGLENLGMTTTRFLAIWVSLIILEGVQYVQAKQGVSFIFTNSSKPLRWAYYYALVFAILFFGYLGAQPFIYFKF